MVIKPFKNPPKPPAEFEQDTIVKLTDAVRAIHQKVPAKHSLEELYRNVESMCKHKKAEDTYKRLYEQCNAHISGLVESLSSQNQDTLLFLQQVETTWNDHQNQMFTIRSVFLFLDTTWVSKESTTSKSLKEMGTSLFRTHLLAHSSVLANVVSATLALIEQERRGEATKRSVLKVVLRMFMELGLYEEPFETQFLESSRAFYEKEGQRLVAELNVADYLNHVGKRLSEETERVSHYLADTTRPLLIVQVEQPLIKKHVSKMLQDGFNALAENRRVEDLTHMYLLIERVGGLVEMKATFAGYIEVGVLCVRKSTAKWEGEGQERELLREM